MKTRPTPEQLHELLIVNEISGDLTWRERPPEMFSHCKDPETAAYNWNARHSGKPALTAAYRKDVPDRPCGKIWNRRYFARDVVEAMVMGKWPEPHVRSRSGVTGVYHIKGGPTGERWCARILRDGKLHNLGTYRKKEDAIAARKRAEEPEVVAKPVDDTAWDNIKELL